MLILFNKQAVYEKSTKTVQVLLDDVEYNSHYQKVDRMSLLIKELTKEAELDPGIVTRDHKIPNRHTIDNHSLSS